MKFCVTRTARLSTGLLMVMLAVACGSAARSAQLDENRGTSSVVVIQGEELWRLGGGLLDGMRSRLAAMQVSRPMGGCPVVLFRGHRTIYGSLPPEVYVDGTRMTDTCVLDHLRVVDIERVEVYRGSVPGATGYAQSPNGLIAVFLLHRNN
jgi:hypothetical protein